MSVTCAECSFVEPKSFDLCANCQRTLPGGVGLWLGGRPDRGGEFAEGVDIVWKRIFGNFYTNVRWRVRHHSPTGMEIGYTGSGPADLSLNTMVALFPAEQGDTVKIWQSHVSWPAWSLHQDFKVKFLASADRNEGRIAWDDIIAWIKTQRTELEERMPEE